MNLKGLASAHSGERTNGEGKAVSNLLLLGIPVKEFNAIRFQLEYVILEGHKSLHEPNEKSEFVYFLNDGLLSLVVLTQDGRTVEAGIVGREGIVGLASVVGLRDPLREIVQISGSGFKIEAADLRSVLPAMPKFQTMLNHYAVLHGLQVSQTAACNRLHDAVQRLARWLLMTQDRIDSGLLRITHDFLATMLGTDRPSITLAALQLQRRGLIEYSRGAVKILNRKKLETFACECYGVIQQFNGELGLR